MECLADWLLLMHVDSCLPHLEQLWCLLPMQTKCLSPPFCWNLDLSWAPWAPRCCAWSWWRVKRALLTIRNTVPEETRSPTAFAAEIVSDISLKRGRYEATQWDKVPARPFSPCPSQTSSEPLWCFLLCLLADRFNACQYTVVCLHHAPGTQCSDSLGQMSCVPRIISPGYHPMLPKAVIQETLLCLNVSIFYCLE